MQTAVPKPIILETERLFISELTPEIYHHLFTACSDKEIMNYIGLKTTAELDEEKDKFSKGLTTYFHSFKNFRLLRKTDGVVVGRCGYHTWIVTHRRAEIGYAMLDDTYKHQGYMTEALGPILAYGFEEMGLQRIEAYIADYNIPSAKLLQHYGFQREGVARDHYVVDGVNENSTLLSLIRPEYEQLKSSWGLKYKVVR